MKQAQIALVLAAIAVMSFAATAQARGKVLSIKRAAAVTSSVAERQCERDPNCDRSEAASCRRQAIRRVSCRAVTEGTGSLGDYRCESLVVVRLVSRTGNVRYTTGDRDCTGISRA